jgi:hypothetical protein
MGANPIKIQFEFEQIGRFCDMSSSDNGVLDSGTPVSPLHRQPQAGDAARTIDAILQRQRTFVAFGELAA